jgi:hypothetical protein
MAVMKPDPADKLCIAETNSLLSVDALTGEGGGGMYCCGPC